MERSGVEMRGGGPVERVGAFRARVRGGALAAIMVAALAVFALAAALFDLGQARQTGAAYWLAPVGLLLLPVAAGLGWFALRRPVALTIGPEGLYQPIACTAPLPWRDVWRMRCVRRKGGQLTRALDALGKVDNLGMPSNRHARQTVPKIEPQNAPGTAGG